MYYAIIRNINRPSFARCPRYIQAHSLKLCFKRACRGIRFRYKYLSSISSFRVYKKNPSTNEVIVISPRFVYDGELKEML